jgi:hypothetical protein
MNGQIAAKTEQQSALSSVGKSCEDEKHSPALEIATRTPLVDKDDLVSLSSFHHCVLLVRLIHVSTRVRVLQPVA